MSINTESFSQYIVQPTVQQLLPLMNSISTQYITPQITQINSCAIERLLVSTATCETHLGSELFCTRTGGLGIFRITAQKHWEIWDHTLINAPELASKVRGFASQQEFLRAPDQELMTNLAYATAIAMVIYWRNFEFNNLTMDVNNWANAWARSFDNGTGDWRDCTTFLTNTPYTIPQKNSPQLVA